MIRYLWLFILLCGTARADCDEIVTVSEFAQQVSIGDAAYTQMDDAVFDRSVIWIYDAIPCLVDGVNPGQVTSLHRLQALSAFVSQDPALTTLYFQAVLANAPNYEIPDQIAPQGHPLRLHFEVARGLPTVAEMALAEPRAGWIQVDGRPAAGIPQDRPYFFQYFDENGRAVHSALLLPGEETPRYPSTSRGTRQVRVPLAILSGVAALGSGALYIASGQAEAQFWDSSTPMDELEGLQAQANGLAWASLLVGGASAGVGVAALWTRSF